MLEQSTEQQTNIIFSSAYTHNIVFSIQHKGWCSYSSGDDVHDVHVKPSVPENAGNISRYTTVIIEQCVLR